MKDRPHANSKNAPVLKSVIGTKSISVPRHVDPVYESLSKRIEVQKSVALWSYVRNDQMAHIKIEFSDTDIALDIKVDVCNMTALQEAIDNVDKYFILKSQRC